MVSPESDIQIAETRAAGWAWRCWPCDITQASLDKVEATFRANSHEQSREHQFNRSQRDRRRAAR